MTMAMILNKATTVMIMILRVSTTTVMIPIMTLT